MFSGVHQVGPGPEVQHAAGYVKWGFVHAFRWVGGGWLMGGWLVGGGWWVVGPCLDRSQESSTAPVCSHCDVVVCL